MRKHSAYLEEILRGLDPGIKDKAVSIKAVVDGFEEKVLEEPISFKVGEYEVIVEARGDRERPDLHLSCTCSYWVYQGPEFHALQNDYLYGTNRGTAQKPETKDPEGTHKVCKHAYAVLRDFFGE
jgi:hypothetical protein